jgi:hypothetical protein
MPSGSDVFLALTKPALERMESSTKTVTKELGAHPEKWRNIRSWQELEGDAEMRRFVVKSTENFAAMFCDPQELAASKNK